MTDQQTVFERIIQLGHLYKDYRKAIGLSQQDVHRKTGVALSTISLFENGKGHGLSLEHFYLLIDAVGLPLDETVLIPQARKSNLASLWEKQNKKSK